MNDIPDRNIADLRGALDALRRSFADTALNAEVDEPTRYFSQKALDAFETLDLAMRSFDFAHRHSESGGDR